MTDDDDGTTAPKTAKPKARKPAAKTPAKAAKPKPAPAESPAPVLAVAAAAVAAPAVVSADLKKKELLDRVAAIVGARKGGVKEIVEATLAVLGEALSKGEALNLPPLGRAKVSRQKDTPSGAMIVVKLRRGNEKNADDSSVKKPRKEALADAGE